MFRSGLARREQLVVAGVFATLVLAYGWSGHVWVDLVDEGYFLDLADRVQNGALPYRDFATYYTPGVFYLFAAAFKLFGTDLLTIRWLMALVRGVCLLLVYGLTRRLAPGTWAWLPVACIIAFDAWPIEPEPHPSWPALAACLATIECVARHLANSQRRWLALAGAAAAISFLFKQNTGAFTVLALAGYVLLRPRANTGALLRAAQIAYTAIAAGLVIWLMHPLLDPLWTVGLLLPVLVCLAALLDKAVRGSPLTSGDVVVDALASGGAFVAVTAMWLVPLGAALGPAHVPIGLFVGDVNQAALAETFPPLTPGALLVLLLAMWLPLVVGRPRGTRAQFVLAALASASLLVWPRAGAPGPPSTTDPLLLPAITWPDHAVGSLDVYLPSLALWVATIGLLASGSRLLGALYVYCTLFGALVGLTLYPRADALHAVVASPPLLIAATGALAHFAGRFSGWRQTLTVVALLTVPAAALAAHVAWRVAVLDAADVRGQRLDYAQLELPRAPVLVPRQTAEDLDGVVAYVQARTRPGEPVLAYPVVPLINFLADRPNPTRFDHFLPGSLSSADFAEVLEDLRSARPRYVVWDDYGVHFWETDPDNRPISDYIWSCYRQVATFGAYLVLERTPEPEGC